MLPCARTKGKSSAWECPDVLWFGRSPPIDTLRVFGCGVLVKVHGGKIGPHGPKRNLVDISEPPPTRRPPWSSWTQGGSSSPGTWCSAKRSWFPSACAWLTAWRGGVVEQVPTHHPSGSPGTRRRRSPPCRRSTWSSRLRVRGVRSLRVRGRQRRPCKRRLWRCKRRLRRRPQRRHRCGSRPACATRRGDLTCHRTPSST